MLQLKARNAISGIYHDGKGSNYVFSKDYAYGVNLTPNQEPQMTLLEHIKVPRNQIQILSDNKLKSQNIRANSKPKASSSVELPSFLDELNYDRVSPDQRDKGIGIIEETEKVRHVAENGDCSDGGSSEPKVLHQSVLDRQQQQLQSALQDGG